MKCTICEVCETDCKVLDVCKFVTGVALILKKDNKILLFKRNIPEKIAYGFFALPGGTVELR